VNLGAVVHGAEMFYLSAKVHGAELGVYVLNLSKRGTLVRIFRKRGKRKKKSLALTG
jgi:hypothetical protein